MKNKMQDLRDHLFVQLERLGDADTPPSKEEIDRARAVNETARTLIDSARVEVEFLRVKSESPRLNGIQGSEFLQTPKALPPTGGTTTEPDR